jgi:hypothetical protein
MATTMMASTAVGAATRQRRLVAMMAAHLGTGQPTMGAVAAEAPGAPPTEIFRANYQAPAYLIPTVEMHVSLGLGTEPTVVQCTLDCQRQVDANGPLVLDGEVS